MEGQPSSLLICLKKVVSRSWIERSSLSLREACAQRKGNNKKDAYLKRYTRKDRQDVISILKLHDLKALMSYRVWEYDQGIDYL